MKFFIVTFGCQQNQADSERIAAFYKSRGYIKARSIRSADDIVINTCMIRESAENRVYGLVHNLSEEKKQGRDVKIVITGCMVGMAVRDRSGRMLRMLKRKLPMVDEFMPIEEVGFDNAPVRTDRKHAWVPITNGCNNFCTFCVVPLTRGREISRAYADILDEVKELAGQGYTHVTLLGQNVNSYGADLVVGEKNVQVLRDLPGNNYFAQPDNPEPERVTVNGRTVTPTYVKHLGRLRIPTLFPQLLRDVCSIDGVQTVDFLSSNPWDFSDDLIRTIADNPKVSRQIHLPVQSGDDAILKKMNRWYTAAEYLALVDKLKRHISGVTISTDIIVGFCGETEEQFEHTVSLCRSVRFSKAYIAMYSDRQGTAAHKVYHDDVPYREKKRRWQILEDLINKKNLKRGTFATEKQKYGIM